MTKHPDTQHLFPLQNIFAWIHLKENLQNKRFFFFIITSAYNIALLSCFDALHLRNHNSGHMYVKTTAHSGQTYPLVEVSL